jgi:hypothetical protein
MGVVNYTLRPLQPQEKSLGSHWIRGWEGPRAGQGVWRTETVLYITKNVTLSLCLTEHHALTTQTYGDTEA